MLEASECIPVIVALADGCLTFVDTKTSDPEARLDCEVCQT